MITSLFSRIVFLLSLLVSLEISGVTLHTILIGDMLAEDIRRCVKQDIAHMQKEVERIETYTELPTQKYVVSGDLPTSDVLNDIENMQIEEDDIVLFFFSGHGYRTRDKKNIWPNLYFTQEQFDVNFATILFILSEKKPRFLLAIADCCNRQRSFGTVLMHSKGQSVAEKEVLAWNYQHLFLNPIGTIFVSSSSAEEDSYCEPIHGSCFTYFFLKELHHAVCSEEIPNWETILFKVKKKLASLSFDEPGATQTPQFLIDLVL